MERSRGLLRNGPAVWAGHLPAAPVVHQEYEGPVYLPVVDFYKPHQVWDFSPYGPSVTDRVCRGNCYYGGLPSSEILQHLIEDLHDADCNVVYDRDEGGADTPWTNVLAAAFAAALFPETRDEWLGWMPTVRLFAKNGAKMNRRTVHQVVAHMQRIRMNMLDGERAYDALQSVLGGDEELALRQLRGELTL
ncbi:hypothetical protein LA080_000768 [Diaporthe eres]|nr:hypothetical protein LA080_000768 [Diaporthe eres]